METNAIKDEKMVELPDHFESVVEVTNDQPKFFLKYGTYIVLLSIVIGAILLYPIYFKYPAYSTIANVHLKTILTTIRSTLPGTVDSIYAPDNTVVSKGQTLLSFKRNQESNDQIEHSTQLTLISPRKGWIRYDESLKKGFEFHAGQALFKLKQNTDICEGEFLIPYSLAKYVHNGNVIQIDASGLISDNKVRYGEITAISRLITYNKNVSISFSFKLPSFQDSMFYFDSATVKISLDYNVRKK